MREGVVVADLTDPSQVYGVHGSEGLSRWKCLARRAGLFGGWEAVEWAWIPPGGVSGEHLHTRTEEVYFILTGRGVITLNGRGHPVQAGQLILTGLGTAHGLRTTGTQGLGWLVIEVSSPATTRALHHTGPGHGAGIHPNTAASGDRSAQMSSSTIINLRASGRVDPRRWLTGPLRAIQLITLDPDEPVQLTAQDLEHTLFTLHGTGTLTRGQTTVSLGPDVAVTLPLGTTASVVAGPQGLEYFHASLHVPTHTSPHPPTDAATAGHDHTRGGAR